MNVHTLMVNSILSPVFFFVSIYFNDAVLTTEIWRGIKMTGWYGFLIHKVVEGSGSGLFVRHYCGTRDSSYASQNTKHAGVLTTPFREPGAKWINCHTFRCYQCPHLRRVKWASTSQKNSWSVNYVCDQTRLWVFTGCIPQQTRRDTVSWATVRSQPGVPNVTE
jgi:hypothetical protein